jgi:prepilin-type N-terminal cleavage/methylation domain-containing protein
VRPYLPAGSGQLAVGRTRRSGFLPAAHCPPTSSSGFTLIELVVVLAVIGILTATVTPAVVQRVVDARAAATLSEVQTLHEAIVGDHRQSRFGFVGDIGRMPNNFQELVQRGSLPSYTTNTTRGIGMGWRGPYINAGASPTDYAFDGFGRPYTGASSGQVRSAGADGVANTPDDIVYPPSPAAVTGHVTVTTKTIAFGRTRVDLSGYYVELLYALNGNEAEVRDSNAPFTFANVPIGIHAVRVIKSSNPNSGSVVSQDTIVVRPGSTVAAELWY